MNTIKVYLSSSGSIASVSKDFPLFQYQYQNKLLNVYVPTSLTSPEFVVFDEFNNLVKDYVAGTAVKTQMGFVTTNGKQFISKEYYLRYLKTLTQNGVEYALFERKLPKEFTMYAGAGANSPVMAFNVINVNVVKVNEESDRTILNITSSQTCNIDVMPSLSQDIDEAIESTQAEELEARVNAIDEKLIDKQDKNDTSIVNLITEDDPNVVRAINDVMALAKNDNEILTRNSQNIRDITTRVQTLEQNISGGEYFVGQLAIDHLPSDSELADYVFRILGRQRKANDVVIVIVHDEFDTDTVYKYRYTDMGWRYYEIQYLQGATNTAKGIVMGNYTPSDTTTEKISFDIQDGEIKGVYFNHSSYKNISVGTMLQFLEDVYLGRVAVERASKDSNDNVIDTTYMTKVEGATKTQLREYALPKVFNDIMYFDLATNGFVTKRADLNPAYPQKVVNINTIGETSLGDFIYTIPQVDGLDVNFQINSKNSCELILPLLFSTQLNETYAIKVETYSQKLIEDDVFDTEQLLGVERLLIDMANVSTSSVKDYKIDVMFSELESSTTDFVELQSGDRIIQKLYIVAESSQANEVTYYSNSIYASSMGLNVSSAVKTILKGEIDGLELSIGDANIEKNSNGFSVDSTGRITYDNQEETIIFTSREIPLKDNEEIVFNVSDDSKHINAKLSDELKQKIENSGAVNDVLLGNTSVLNPQTKNAVIPTTTPNTIGIIDAELVDVDTYPTLNSNNLITSGGVAEALYNAIEGSITSVLNTSI